MWELYIVRHGIAVEHGTPGIPDDERPLTSRGEKRMREITEGLDDLDLAVERIATSPLPRARRTAEILAEGLDLAGSIELAPVLRADSTAQDVAEWLGLQPEAPLMIVGHNPILDELLSLLLLGDPRALPFTFKKGGVAALRRPSPDSERHELQWLAPPRLLRNPSR
ncbi:phosphohistidine phosphatase SixA [Planctomyces sp. SH-PL62]|uniref:phosphohistidine phosphatase SixA n=1 Tax=Planctomyces sp. SH-PL62 TaxID=1636152 RepID=UPI00078C6F77|nr:phosphohistidine phosphatase SixA [Planctomyces sp. SH-PL62]AMV38224.1 Phosphohistidine phosphatase SixA [Planctomyces sp. SH-PL62]